MKLSHFDLNLLRTLDVLLQERNVTRAAERLFITQQAASAALARLRTQFEDELLVRVGRQLELTPLAESLVLPVREALLAAQAVLDTSPDFDPTTARATCRISVSDYCQLVLVPPILRLLSTRAPAIKCILEPLAPDTFEKLAMGELDFCVAAHDPRLYGIHRPNEYICSHKLFSDDFVCVVDPIEVDLSQGMSLKLYQHSHHNLVDFGLDTKTIVQSGWEESGHEYSVAAVTSSFSAVLFMLPGTRMIATVQRRLAEALAPRLGLEIRECPLQLRYLQESLMWHQRMQHAPIHRFIREIIIQAADSLDSRAF